MSHKSPVIGIDLATTYSVCAVRRNGQTEVIANDQGNRSTPSVVAFSEGKRLVGEPAKNQAALNPENTIYEIKRLMGRTFDDPKVQELIKKFPYKVVNKNNKPCVQVLENDVEKTFSPEEISAMIISEMKRIAENFLGETVKDAVITVPAYFNEQAKAATKDAAMIAGINVLRLISEPTAAAVCYGLDNKSAKEKKICVLDAGGGTYDISILAVDEGVFEVLSVGGNTMLGGADFDNALVEHCVAEFQKKTGKNISGHQRAVRRLRTVCERAKRTLSSELYADIEVDSLFEGEDFNYKLSRAKFESLVYDILKKHVDLIDPVIKDSKVSKSDINEIILVGGTTRIPKLRQMISEYFGGKTLNTSVNPDEAIAIGASLQAAVLSGQTDSKTEQLLVIDVTPLSIGIETAGGVMTKIIERNSTIPISKEQVFSTFEDNQPAVDIQIFEGERALTRDCNKLGTFRVNDLPRAPRGTLKIKVKMSLDANGILEVTASEESTGKSNNIKITNDSTRLSKEDIERMVRDAETYREQDKKIQENREAYNRFDTVVREAKKMSDKVSSKDDFETFIKEHETWIQNHPDETAVVYNDKMKDFNEQLQKFTPSPEPEEQSTSSTSKGPTVSEVD